VITETGSIKTTENVTRITEIRTEVPERTEGKDHEKEIRMRKLIKILGKKNLKMMIKIEKMIETEEMEIEVETEIEKGTVTEGETSGMTGIGGGIEIVAIIKEGEIEKETEARKEMQIETRVCRAYKTG